MSKRKVRAGDKPNMLEIKSENAPFDEETTIYRLKDYDSNSKKLNDWRFLVFNQMGYKFFGSVQKEGVLTLKKEVMRDFPNAEFLEGVGAYDPKKRFWNELYAVYFRI